MKFQVVRASDALRFAARAAVILWAGTSAMTASAVDMPILTGPIQEVIVNGGPDTVNGGLTCFSMPDLPAQCRGLIAIPNRNKDLLAAALMARSRGGNSRVYMQLDPAQNHHCPGFVFTSCQAISISVQ